MLFGSSGIRRPYDLPLAELALSLGTALAATADGVVVGMDTRTSSPVLADAAIAGLLGAVVGSGLSLGGGRGRARWHLGREKGAGRGAESRPAEHAPVHAGTAHAEAGRVYGEARPPSPARQPTDVGVVPPEDPYHH